MYAPMPAASPYHLAALDPGGGAAAGAYGHSLKQHGMAPSNPYVYHSLDAAEAALAQVRAPHHHHATGGVPTLLTQLTPFLAHGPAPPAAQRFDQHAHHHLPLAGRDTQERAQQQHLSAYPFAGLATSETGWTPGEVAHYSTDEFRMFQFKVYRCTKRFAHDWRTCPFAHPTENARRRDPNQYRYSATACPDYKQGFCLRGEMCPYSHGVFESWLHPSRYRTQLCKDGTACSRPLCFFAHSLPELRAPTHTWVPTSEDLQPGPQAQSPFALQPAQRSASQPPDTPGSPSQGLVQAAAQLAAVSLSNEDSSDDSSKPSDSVVGNAGPGPQAPRSHARAALPRQPHKSHPHHHMQRGGGRPSHAHTAPSAAALGLTTPRMSNAFARRHGLNPKDNAMLNLQKIAIQQAQLANGGVPPHSANTNTSGSGGGSARALSGAKGGQHSSNNGSNNAAAHKQSSHATAAAAANSVSGMLNSSSLEQLSSQQQLQQELSNAAALNHVAAAAANAAASLPSNGSAAAPSPQSAAAAAVAAVAAAADQGSNALSSGSSGSATQAGRLSNNGGSGASSHHSNSSHNSSLHLSNLSRDSSGPISAGSAGSSGHSNANSSGSPLGMLPAGMPSATAAPPAADAQASPLLQPSLATAAPPTPPLMHIGGANQAAAAAGATHGMMLPLLQPTTTTVGAGPCDALLGGAAAKGGTGVSVGSNSAAQADAAALAALQHHFQAMSFAQPSVQEQQAQQQAQRIELQAQVQVQQHEQQAQQSTKLLQDYMHSIQQQQQSTY